MTLRAAANGATTGWRVTRLFDILVTDAHGERLCSIQVKTRRDLGSYGGWHMRQKHEDIRSDRLFYCLVDLGKDANTRPVVHVLPSKVVAEVLSKAHERWLATPGKSGQQRNDGPMRRLLPDYSRVFGSIDNPYPAGRLNQYRDAWKLLSLEASAPLDGEHDDPNRKDDH